MPIVEFAQLPQRNATVRQWHKIVWPFMAHRLTVGCLGEKLVKVYCHWHADIKRPRPCPGIDECKFCTKIDRRVYCYFAAITTGDHDLIVAEVSSGCAEQMDKDGLLKQNLRGYIIELYRKAPDPRKPVKANDPVFYKATPPKPGAKIPPKFSVMPSLLRLWGWTEEHLDEVKAKIDAKKAAEPNCLTDFLRQAEEIE